jgi:hypothetical protein
VRKKKKGLKKVVSRKEALIREAHELLRDGRFPSCARAVEAGCRRCCNQGSVLMDGEVLSIVPEGVKVTGKRIRNCLGEMGCEFGKDKPLICKLFPHVSTGIDEKGWFFDSRADMDCPAPIPRRLKGKMRVALLKVRAALDWEGRYSPLEPADEADRDFLMRTRVMRSQF